MPRFVPNIERRTSSRAPKVAFYLFCEGRLTEPDYFSALRRVTPYSLVDIRPIPGVGVPKTIAERAAEEAKRLGIFGRRSKAKNSFEESDEVWAVFDRDEHPDFDEAIKMCAAANVGVARSNPCFEVWLILHFEDYDRPDHRHNTQDHLGKICPTYDRKGSKTTDFTKLVDAIEAAEKRAEQQLQAREKEGAPFSAPSTTVFQLTRRLRRGAPH